MRFILLLVKVSLIHRAALDNLEELPVVLALFLDFFKCIALLELYLLQVMQALLILLGFHAPAVLQLRPQLVSQLLPNVFRLLRYFV